MYIEAYRQQGLHIDTFVPQNEPGFEPNGYDDHHHDGDSDLECEYHNCYDNDDNQDSYVYDDDDSNE